LEVFSHEISHSSPLLILSERQLPNRKTVHLPFLGDEKSWVAQVHEVWSKFNSPSLRVFLPKGVDAKEFSSHWPKAGGKKDVDTLEISFVLDSGGH
jgi:hypothetical protein